MSSPLFSIVMCVKNGMPYLPEALRSVAAQTYRNFELVIQDGGSTDGTLDVLHSVTGVPEVHVKSEPDNGQGQGHNRALARCNGAIIGTIDADNLLAPDALEGMASLFAEHPDVAAMYGGANLIDAQGGLTDVFIPAPFDLMRMLRSELVPPFAASFFSRRICGAHLRFDDGMATCHDFDLWLRLGHLPILMVPRVVASMRYSGTNLTSIPANYDRFCREKIAALRNHVADRDDPLLTALWRQLSAGVYCWAAECVFTLEGASDRVRRYLRLSADLDPGYGRIHGLEASLPQSDAPVVARSVSVDAALQSARPPAPATAYWNQRFAIAMSSDRLRLLRERLDDAGNLSSFQWAQWFAYAREYRPDLVIELGRQKGSATVALVEALHQNQHGMLVSLCETNTWNETSLPRLRPLVEPSWLERLDARTQGVKDADFPRIVGDARRVLVAWDAAGFDVAARVLARLMPVLQDRRHVVIMHDISDLRYCGSTPAYGDACLWRGSDWATRHHRYDCRLHLGWIDTLVEQAIAVVDFLARNGSELESADHSFHLDIGADAAKRMELNALLAADDFNLMAHWAYFSLNGVARPYTFPKDWPPDTPETCDPPNAVRFWRHIVGIARNIGIVRR